MTELWTDQTWNPVTGCTPVSPACDRCYAERMSHRLKGRYGYPADEPFRVTLHPDRLDEPLRWRKPRRVFVCSMGDLFHEDVPMEYIARVFGVMALTCPDAWIVGGRPIPIGEHHIFQILTKRPKRMHALLTDPNFPGLVGSVSGILPLMPMPHVWLGVTVESQEQARDRIGWLFSVPAAKRFVSCEPLLGPLDLARIEVLPEEGNQPGIRLNALTGHVTGPDDMLPERLDWIIVGAESGPGARPANPAWFQSLRDQCAAAGVPFYLKDRPGTIDGREYREFPRLAPGEEEVG